MEKPLFTSRSQILKKIVRFYVTVCFLGLIPYAPGTFGTLGGVLIFIIFSSNKFIYLIIILWILVTGTILSGIAEKKIFKKKDSKEIVIDEVAGYLITTIELNFDKDWYLAIIAFILFRIFDILKPFPISRLQHLKSGFGIMADDIMAGLYVYGILWIIDFYNLINKILLIFK